MGYVKHYLSLYALPFCMILFSLSMLVALMTFSAHDQSMLYHTRQSGIHNFLGYFGSSLAALLVYAFGSGAFIFVFLFCYVTVIVCGLRSMRQDWDRLVGLFFLLSAVTMLCSVYQGGLCEFSCYGGWFGALLIKSLGYFDATAQAVIAYSLLGIALVLLLRFAHLHVARLLLRAGYSIGNYVLQLDHMPARAIRGIATGIAYGYYALVRVVRYGVELLSGSAIKKSELSVVAFEHDKQADDRMKQLVQDLTAYETAQQNHEQQGQETVETNNKFMAVGQEKSQEFESVTSERDLYQLPDVDRMLAHGNNEGKYKIVDQTILDEQVAILEEKLAQFGIKGQVTRVHPGPVITLFEYRPENHIKLSKILALEDDLAMALQALSIRILAPIPGKAVVGFEVANKVRKPVLLSNIFASTAWNHFEGNLPLILGENTQGDYVVVDLAAMPHLLIAGSTGSGKSVAVNCMLVSLLCACSPEQVKLIIIDPKQLEFSAYEDIAHLLFPIITDCKKAVPVLTWLVSAMEQRYAMMAEHGVKNILEYQRLAQGNSELEPMPFIVLIIDELADLMMTTGKDVEDLLARIAQMSRAAGIHMIVATQRPSVDVITGLIKVNFPNRISFKVTSKVDSRTILDEIGAERLLGKGDMLFLDAKDPDIKRIHGAYVSNKEVQFLVNHIKAQQKVSYLDIADLFAGQITNDALLDVDKKLYQEIVSVVRQCDEISISMIQRRFRIGYNRSARIVEALENDGLILPSDGSKMRRVIK